MAERAAMAPAWVSLYVSQVLTEQRHAPIKADSSAPRLGRCPGRPILARRDEGAPQDIRRSLCRHTLDGAGMDGQGRAVGLLDGRARRPDLADDGAHPGALAGPA